jgi:hypothetical protein
MVGSEERPAVTYHFLPSEITNKYLGIIFIDSEKKSLGTGGGYRIHFKHSFINRLLCTEFFLRSCYSATQTIPNILWNPKSIKMFITACHWPLPWARCIQSTLFQPISLRFTLIVSSQLHSLLMGIFPSGFPNKHLNAHLFSPMHAICSAHLIIIDLIILTECSTQMRPRYKQS